MEFLVSKMCCELRVRRDRVRAESALSQPQSHTGLELFAFALNRGAATSKAKPDSLPFAFPVKKAPFCPVPRSVKMAPSFDTLTEQDLHEEEVEEEIDFSGE